MYGRSPKISWIVSRWIETVLHMQVKIYEWSPKNVIVLKWSLEGEEDDIKQVVPVDMHYIYKRSPFFKRLLPLKV